MAEDARCIVRRGEIEAMKALRKVHFLDPRARRVDKSLGDLTGIGGSGFHIIAVAPGDETTEQHVHPFEDECAYVLESRPRRSSARRRTRSDPGISLSVQEEIV